MQFNVKCNLMTPVCVARETRGSASIQRHWRHWGAISVKFDPYRVQDVMIVHS